MNERDIERAAINEILKETKIAEERNRPPENGYCVNKRLLSRNLVSTLRNPVFPKNLKKRRIIGLDDETEDESDTNHKRRKYSRGQNHFADDDYIYDARDYFNPEKYREIVAYRNRKRQRRECYQKKESVGYVGSSFYVHDARENNYHDDKLGYRELQDYASEEHEADVVDEKSRIELLAISSTSSCVLENTNNSGTFNHRKRKHRKSKDTSTHSQQKKRSKPSKHRHKHKLGCVQDEDKKHGKCKKHKTCIKKNSRHKKKRESKKQKKSYSSDTELDKLNQHEVEGFSEIKSDCLGNFSPCGSRYSNKDSGSSVQSTLCYNSNISTYRQSEDDYSYDVEQFVNGHEASYDGGALVSAEYLNELYFRIRHKSDSDERNICSVVSSNYNKNHCIDGVLDTVRHCRGSIVDTCML